MDQFAQQALDTLSERLAETARLRFAGDLRGKLILAGGLSGAGAVQPLAVTRLGGAFLGLEPNAELIKAAMKAGYCEIMVNNLDEALRILKNAVRRREPASVGLLGDPEVVTSELAIRGIVPGVVLISSALPKESPGVAQLRLLGSVILEAASPAPSK